MLFMFQKASKKTSKLKMGQLQTISRNVILLSESLKQTSNLKTKQLETIDDNIILVSESIQTDIEIENEGVTDCLW